SPALADVRRHTTAGMRPSAADSEMTCRPSAQMDRGEALARFAARTGYPPLPTSFNLSDHDVLLIMADSVRTEATSLAGADNTPNLERLRRLGAFAFTRAYASAAYTWYSVSSIFAMAPPATAPLTATLPTWTGELREEALTVPEIFQESGYRTLSVRHDFPGFVGDRQGFASHHVEPGKVRPRR